MALSLTEDATNDGKLNNVNRDVVHVRFLEALETTTEFNDRTSGMPGMGDDTDGTGDGRVGDDSTCGVGAIQHVDLDNVPGRSWGLVATGIIAFLVALCYLIRQCHGGKRGNERGQFDPDETTAMRSGMQAPINADAGNAASWMDVGGALQERVATVTLCCSPGPIDHAM